MPVPTPFIEYTEIPVEKSLCINATQPSLSMTMATQPSPTMTMATQPSPTMTMSPTMPGKGYNYYNYTLFSIEDEMHHTYLL